MKQPTQQTVRTSFIRGGAALAALAFPAMCFAANVTMNADDASGTSSFNSNLHWNDGSAPSAGNDYFSGNFTLRTPANGNSYTFLGDSLTINNNSAYPKGLLYKGTGSTGIITINNLILDHGVIGHASGATDAFNLYGNINVVGDSILYPKQGAINIYSAIHGTSKLTIQASDANSAFKIWIRSSANTFTGDIVNNGRLELADNANLNFVIGANGVNNRISNGTLGTQQHSIFGGDFVIDLSGASTTVGDSWSLVSTVLGTTYYGTTFTVAGFDDLGGDLWGVAAHGVNYQFSELSGVLSVISVVPEPSTFALAGIGLVGLLVLRRRKSA
jgi:hypothetical protein